MATASNTETRSIEIDLDRMIDGLFELFDDLADFALNRVVRQTEALKNGFNPTVVPQTDVDRFKILWFVTLGELMFREIRGTKIATVIDAFYTEMALIAGERQAQQFLEETKASVRQMIDTDTAYARNGTVNTVEDGNGVGTRNRGLAPNLATMITNSAFSKNAELAPVFEAVSNTVTDELLNAYGHSSLACAPFVIN